MKKIILLMSFLISTNIHAKVTVWKLDKPNNGYMIINYKPGHQIANVQFLVESMINDKVADKVAYKCNNSDSEKYLIPDSWITCNVQPNDIAYVLVNESDFINGANVLVNDLDSGIV